MKKKGSILLWLILVTPFLGLVQFPIVKAIPGLTFNLVWDSGVIGTGTDSNVGRNIIISGSYLYAVSGSSKQFVIYDITTLESPVLKSNTNLGYFATDIRKQGNYVFISILLTGETGYGVCVYDVSSVTSPSFVTYINMGAWGHGLFIEGSYLYVGGYYHNKFQIIDISNPESPVLKGSLSGTTYFHGAHDVWVDGNIAYVTNYLAEAGEYSLTVVNVTDKNNPAILLGLLQNRKNSHVFKVGDYLYVGAHAPDSGMTVWNITNRENPVYVETFFTTEANIGYWIASYNATVLVAVSPGAGKLYMIDISTPDNPTIITSTSTPLTPRNVATVGNHVFTSTNSYSTPYVWYIYEYEVLGEEEEGDGVEWEEEWLEREGNPIADVPRSWADEVLDNPRFIRKDNDTIYLYLQGWEDGDPGGEIGLMKSTDDGESWTWETGGDPIPGFANTSQSWSSGGDEACPAPVVVGDMIYMFYSSRPSEMEWYWNIGVANSTNWIDFTPDNENSPLVSLGEVGSWDEYCVFRHTKPVLKDDIWYIYYIGRSSEGVYGVGYISTSSVDFPGGWVKQTVDVPLWFIGELNSSITLTKTGTTYMLYYRGSDGLIKRRTSTTLGAEWGAEYFVPGFPGTDFVLPEIDIFETENHGYIAAVGVGNYWTEGQREIGIWEWNPLTITISDMEGCGNWVFTEEKYYSFVAKFSTIFGAEVFDTVKIKFSDGVHSVIPYYSRITEDWGLENGSNAVRMQHPSAISTDTSFIVTWKIYFTNIILDALDVDIYGWYNTTTGGTEGWKLYVSNYFNIYNLGGKADYLFAGDGSHISGGDVFELQAGTNGSWAAANVTWKYLQHIHMLFSLDTGRNVTGDHLSCPHWEHSYYGSVTYGIYIYYNGQWIKEYWVTLLIAGGYVGTHGVSPNEAWVCMEARWYHLGELIKTDLFYTYNWGVEAVEDQFTFDPSMKFWVDLWFNKINGSTTIGGRVNAYWTGLASGGWWIWSNYKPIYTNITQSMFFGDLKDGGGNIISSKQLTLMKVFCNVSKSPEGCGDIWKLKEFDVFTIKQATSSMEGIDTPSSEFQPTQDPTMPMGGFLGGLTGWISGLINAIGSAATTGVMTLLSYFIGFLDTLFTFAGWNNGFSQILSMISDFLTYMVTGLVWVATMLLATFGFFTSTLTWVLGMFVSVVNVFLQIASIVVGIIRGTYSLTTGLGDIVSYINLDMTFVSLVILLSWWLSIDSRAKKGIYGGWMTIFISDLQSLMNLLSFVFDIIMRIASFVVDTVFYIIEAIPIAE